MNYTTPARGDLVVSISGDAANHSDGLCLFPNHNDGHHGLGAL
jgi:hypothetical protein